MIKKFLIVKISIKVIPVSTDYKLQHEFHVSDFGLSTTGDHPISFLVGLLDWTKNNTVVL